MSSVIYLACLVALLVVYCIWFKEKSFLFVMGLVWFVFEIAGDVLSIVFIENLNNLSYLSDLEFNELFFNYNLLVSWERVISCVLVFVIVLCFFCKRRKQKKLSSETFDTQM